MRKLSILAVVLAVGALAAWLGLPVNEVKAARPYEGTTIRAVVNAEYVKLSLIHI